MNEADEPLQTKREIAEQLLEEMFTRSANGRISVQAATATAEARGVCYRTLRRVAAEELSVITIRQGSAAGIWERGRQDSGLDLNRRLV